MTPPTDKPALMTAEALKPCPFCGSQNLEYDTTDGSSRSWRLWLVRCSNSDCSGAGPVTKTEYPSDWPPGAERKEAAELWNTRSDPGTARVVAAGEVQEPVGYRFRYLVDDDDPNDPESWDFDYPNYVLADPPAWEVQPLYTHCTAQPNADRVDAETLRKFLSFKSDGPFRNKETGEADLVITCPTEAEVFEWAALRMRRDAKPTT